MTGPPGDYPRDMVGYGADPPNPQWPGGANIAVQFVLNYEEGAESSVLHGDPGSETFLSDIVGAQPFPNRHMSMESLYEYGSRAGLWRVLRVFDRRGLPLTIFGVAMALARNPQAVAAFQARGDEIACHGLRWISYQLFEPEVERQHLAEAVRLMTELTGAPPLGWYTGRDSPQTRRLVVEHGGFLYDSDSYADDLPYWTVVDGTASGGALHAGHQRHAVRRRRRISERRRVVHLPARRVRRALRRRRGRARPRCCRSGCTAGWSAVPHARPRSSVSSTMCSRTTRCGSRAGSTSRGTGSSTFHRVRPRPRIPLALWLIRWTMPSGNWWYACTGQWTVRTGRRSRRWSRRASSSRSAVRRRSGGTNGAAICRSSMRFPDGRHVIDEVVVAGSHGVTRARFTGTHTGEFHGMAPTGAKVSVGVIHMDRFQGDMLVAYRGQMDMYGLLQQLGGG